LKLKTEISKCTVCAEHFNHSPRPVFAFNSKSKIIIVGQAPGSIVHRTGIPWDDKSGDNLREWMGVSKKEFYSPSNFGIVPMGFCYPGKGKSGDLPPRKECAPQWHEQIFDTLKGIKLILLIGNYAQNYYLPDSKSKTLTSRVIDFQVYLPKYFVLPHPSPRNNIWMKKNPWFKQEVLPELSKKVKKALA